MAAFGKLPHSYNSKPGLDLLNLHDNGKNKIKGESRETMGQKSTGGWRTGYGREAGRCDHPVTHNRSLKFNTSNPGVVNQWFPID